MKREDVNIMIFRRDLRIEDNRALIDLIEETHGTGYKLLPIFIFNPKQIESKSNQYFSKNCVEFMVQCIESLNATLNNSLHCFHGDDVDVLNKLLSRFQIHTIAYNQDFTPYAKERDSRITDWCRDKSIALITSDDYTLFHFDTILTKSGKPYEVFTPFYNTCLHHVQNIPQVQSTNIGVLKSMLFKDTKNTLRGLLVKNLNKYYDNTSNPNLAVRGGRVNALRILDSIKNGQFKHYDKERDYPHLDKTTKMSAYLKFGCISIREAFHTAKKRYGLSSGIVRELIWREFYASITHFFPRVLQGQTEGINRAFKEKYDNLKWGYREDWWKAWCNGTTGFPWIDAGIRQLTTTGWCHNRLRMSLGMFFCKDMLFDWRLFECWMASNLVDYDPSSNSGGVQWTYSVGCDAAPYFRVFSPWAQPQTFDKEALFIKQWVSELKAVPAKDIMKWDTEHSKYSNITTYPPPMLNHTKQVDNAIHLFSRV